MDVICVPCIYLLTFRKSHNWRHWREVSSINNDGLANDSTLNFAEIHGASPVVSKISIGTFDSSNAFWQLESIKIITVDFIVALPEQPLNFLDTVSMQFCRSMGKLASLWTNLNTIEVEKLCKKNFIKIKNLNIIFSFQSLCALVSLFEYNSANCYLLIWMFIRFPFKTRWTKWGTNKECNSYAFLEKYSPI